MAIDVISRLFTEWSLASDNAARVSGHGANDKTLLLHLEQDLCVQLERVGGRITIDNNTFTLFGVLIGKNRLSYFKVETVREPDAFVEGSGGWSFDRLDHRHITPAPEPGETLTGQFHRKMATR